MTTRDDILAQARARLGVRSVNGTREEPKACCTSRLCSLFGSVVGTEMGATPTNRNPGHPATRPFLQTHASIRRRKTRDTRFILRVLSMAHDPDVCPAIVKRIAVDVVDLRSISRPQSKYGSMKIDGFDTTINLLCPYSVSMNAQTPAPLIRPLGISSVNQCIAPKRSVSGSKRKLSNVVNNDDGRNRSLGDASVRAITRFAVFDIGPAGKEAGRASLASAWDGTLLGHRLTPSGGVAPPAVSAARGFSHGEFYHV